MPISYLCKDLRSGFTLGYVTNSMIVWYSNNDKYKTFRLVSPLTTEIEFCS